MTEDDTTTHDEFGDDSIFDNFDVDAAVIVNTSSTKKKKMKEEEKNIPDINNNDSLLVLDNNFDAAVRNSSHKTKSTNPFGPNFKGSIGTITYPDPKELEAILAKQQQKKTKKNPYSSSSSRGSGAENNSPSSYQQQQQKRTLTTESSSVNNNDDESPPPWKKQAKEENQQQMEEETAATTTTTSTTNNTDQAEEQESEALALTKTLSKHFGYSSFRPGQLPIIQSLLNGRDAAVFWSTGSGKSLCYQIPPLHTGKMALVISPLISLMQDQVSKLNGICSSSSSSSLISPLISLMQDQVSKLNGICSSSSSTKKDTTTAVFLGSGQSDPMAEQRALQGKYSLIYCTPEKLVSGNFLDEIGTLHTNNGGGFCLVAIDEAHCVSEWGHDFRKDYRTIGAVLRSHPVMGGIPMVALTATAVPRVQKDILQSLKLRPNVKVIQQSFDRDNLIITVRRKPKQGGYRTALAFLVKEFQQQQNNNTNNNNNRVHRHHRHGSTIIYCPTTSQVEEVTEWLQDQLIDSETIIKVQSYHGGQSMEHRSEAHVNFLTGRTTVIVATLAFGMGIDKTDTRRIIHYGPPKTVEEYYQQIGRAGRDGLEAHCIMYSNNGDFDRYKSDFYLGGLTSSQARANQEESIESLRRYAMSDEVCRRAALLEFFQEVPKFGQRCGTCDTCVARKRFAGDVERDFAVTGGARLLLYVISVLNGKQGTSVLEKVIKGNEIEFYRYNNNNNNESAIHQKVESMKSQMSGYKKRVPVSYFTKDLLPALVSRGYVEVQTQSAAVNGRAINWSGYQLSATGRKALTEEERPIVLPVPASIREYEQEQQAKIQKSLQDLQHVGVNIDQIPKQELEEGDGVVLKALKTWYNYLDLLQRNGRTSRIDELEDLRLRMDAWRMDIASQYRMAPADAMPDHLLLSVAYAAASLKNTKMEKEALLAVGVRSSGIDDLVVAINQWITEYQSETTTTTTMEEDSSNKPESRGACAKMIIPKEPFEPKQAWEHFVYKKIKKYGLASWESSYNRFTYQGEHPQTIAMSPLNGRPITVSTVIGHIFEGVLSGRPIDLSRLATLSTPPTKSEWDTLSRMEAETGICVTEDPKISGKNGDALRLTDFVGPILGEEFMTKDYKDRTPEEQVEFVDGAAYSNGIPPWRVW
eukprot:CAMPEP_0194262828 /NCGR_PEP_ID=MMETSP0158-20130606/46739_1 /TAXON_ID=33649 /ORGANISM="Thalassionema nitzschioides, Strain L26-B" /LENGTH=1147 /DNA_ID=CAMNT_0039002989 /DNA_START=125 /DNA_END=3566 /DNA_ORIENTATION=-